MSSDRQNARKATEAETPAPSDALISPLFSGWPDLGAMVLRHMGPVDRSLLAGVSPSISDAVMKSENPSDASKPLPVAGVTPGFGLSRFTDSLEMFRYGVQTYPRLLISDRNPHSARYGDICSAAASRGALDVLSEARAIGCPWGRTATNACRNGQLQLLQWAHGPFQSDRVQLNRKCYVVAAEEGHLDVIEFLREERCVIDKFAAYGAAYYANPRCLELLYEIHNEWIPFKVGEPDEEWSPDDVCAYAVRSRRKSVLKIAWKLQPAVYDAEIYGNPFMDFSVQPMEWAARFGRTDMMKWLLENGCPWGSYTCEVLADPLNPVPSKWAAEASKLAAEAPNGCWCNSPFGTKMSSTCSVHGDPLI
jgi:hypothetical protein